VCPSYFIRPAKNQTAPVQAGPPLYEDMTHTEIQVVAQKAAYEMFSSVHQNINLPLRFPMRTEMENARVFGDMMSRWTSGFYIMRLDIYPDQPSGRSGPELESEVLADSSMGTISAPTLDADANH
jgi:hypothetical protein